jgi:mRNA-degrading endonuclease toxin of MazEF toxin-antitoxin module
MRLNFLKWLCANVLLGILTISTHTMAQTNYNVPITLSVSNTAIDRVIGAQWASITHSWSGPFYWSTYTLTLSQPVIILADNAIKISMGLTVASPIYNGTFTITPTLTVPPTTITANNIITQYQDLQQQINNYISDNGLRSTIYQDLSPISWIVYQGQILSQSTSLWTTGSYVGWSGTPSLTVVISNNALNLTVTPTIVAAAPSYTWSWERADYYNFGLKIYSNDALQITYLRIYNILSQQLLATSQVASSVWDAANNRYVTTLVVPANQNLANNFDLLAYQVRINRQSAETLWDLTTGPALGYPISWQSFNHVINKRGE